MVRFATVDGRAVTAAAAGDGRFTIAVPPGTYTITGAPTSVPGAEPCRADAPVIVPAAGATDVQVVCQIR